MKNSYLLLLLILGTRCGVKDDDIGKHENYILTENNISEDCNAYQLRFNKEGEYIFSFSLSGTCKKLTKNDYIRAYKDYLSKYSDSLILKRGKIMVNYYSFSDTNNVLVDSIINVTQRNFNCHVTLSEIDDISFTLKVFDND